MASNFNAQLVAVLQQLLITTGGQLPPMSSNFETQVLESLISLNSAIASLTGGSGSVPADASVTDAKVAAGAAIAWTKLSKTGAAASDVGAATATQGANADSHRTATTNIHGLPASVALLGNRTASGEFIQHGATSAINGTLTSFTIAAYRSLAVTFPVAFTSAPRLFCNAKDNGILATATSITSTGFTIYLWGGGALVNTLTADWMAVGA